jgi:hypothetical protein
MLGARIDQGDRGTFQTPHQPVGKRGSSRTCTDDHDPRIGRHRIGVCRPKAGRCQAGRAAQGCKL